MKATIITIVVTSALTAFLTVAGMAIIIPRMIKIPDMSKMPDLAKMEIPDMESIMASQMDGIVEKITEKMPTMPEGMTAGGPPAGITSSTGTTMADNVKKMEQAVKDMKKWAGKMEDSGKEMEDTRDDMAAIFNETVGTFIGRLIMYAGTAAAPGICNWPWPAGTEVAF